MTDGSSHRAVRLLDVEPDLGADLDTEELAQARSAIVCPVIELGPGPWDPTTLTAQPVARGRVFGAIVTTGLGVREVLLADRVCTQVVGPGDFIGLDALAEHPLPLETRNEVPVGMSVALLDDRFLAAGRRWPRMTGRLMDLAAAQMGRNYAHQAISQLPRVEDRLLAIFWHLADRWAQVSGDGVIVSLPLTHETLGRLIGARRPTVSLGLRVLADAGLLTRRPNGDWLLQTGSLSQLSSGDERPAAPAVIRPRPPVVRLAEPAPVVGAERAALLARVAVLRETLENERERTLRSLAGNRQVRAKLAVLREARRVEREVPPPHGAVA